MSWKEKPCYRGYDIEATSTGFTLSQGNYIQDLLRRRNVKGYEVSPMLKETSNRQRTRPDLSYAIGLMSRLIHRRPTYLVKIGDHVFRYLNATPKLGLVWGHPGLEYLCRRILWSKP